MRFDERGNIVLADVPNAGASRVDSNARSGNPRHDVRSGKFGAGGNQQVQRPAPPANVDPVEYARMFDAVREAAREFDNPQEGDIRDFIKGRANAPDQVDIQQFLQQVVEQRKNDLVDLLDQSMRSSGPLSRGRRKVRLSAPRGYMRRLVGSLDEDQLAEVMHRLEAMGHDRADVDAFFNGRHENVDNAKTRRDAISASDKWSSPTRIFPDEAEPDEGYVPNIEVHVHLPSGGVAQIQPESGNVPENTP